jgi:hypothetical protein
MPPVCVEYGKSHRPHIKFVEESAENILCKTIILTIYNNEVLGK